MSRRASAVNEPRSPWGSGVMGLGGDLPDLKVWLALVLAEQAHHAAARCYWQESEAQRAQGRQAWFTRATMLGPVRLLGQPRLMGDGALPLTDALAIYPQLRQTDGVGFVGDQEGTDNTLAALVQGRSALPPRLWTGAWLAACAETAGRRLVTFDADFRRFALTRWLHLGQP